MFCMLKTRKYILHVLKQNPKGEKQFILLMVPNGEGWHYLAVKKFKRNNFKNWLFLLPNCLHSYRIKDKPESLKEGKINIFHML